jgi:hypothetical protein
MSDPRNLEKEISDIVENMKMFREDVLGSEFGYYFKGWPRSFVAGMRYTEKQLNFKPDA